MPSKTLAELGWKPTVGTPIAPGTGERKRWEDLLLPSHMVDALRKYKTQVPIEYLWQVLA